VAAEIRRADMAAKVALISFDQRAIVRLRRLAPEMTRGRIFGRTTADEVLRDAAEAGCELVMPHKGQLGDALVARVRAASLKLATWVVDDPEELRALARYELYGIGTNCPGVLLDAIAEGILS
ncbi:MAG TPA: glycerophosphodiester phosphodiesterase, partial [Vicinamibacteria bacterium]|jgi:glycerophosphoryl diester phosphodiesterase